MSIQDEHELRTRLAGLLDGVELRPAPVATTIRRGRRIRIRRIIGAVAGVAAVVAAVIVLPTVLPTRPHSAPLTRLHYSVSVQQLAPVAHNGVIAQGITDGKSWRVVATGSPHNSVTIQAVGGIGASDMSSGESPTLDSSAPVVLETMGDTRFNIFFGVVTSSVTSVAVRLPDGEQPILTPVSWHGQRWIGLVLPARVPIVRAVAYAGARELAYAVPFRETELVAWWQPGQHGPARVTRSIGSGVLNGKTWHATAWTGPWGWCFSIMSGDTACYASPDNRPPHGTLVQELSFGCADKGSTAAIVVVASDVRRVELRLSNGRSASYRAVAIPGGRVFGYEIPARVRITGSQEYGAHGQLVGSTTSAVWHGC